MSNEKLAQQLAACKSNEETLKVLADNGIQVSAEEMDELMEAAKVQASEGELSEDSLENVAGGAKFRFIVPILLPILPVIWWRK